MCVGEGFAAVSSLAELGRFEGVGSDERWICRGGRAVDEAEEEEGVDGVAGDSTGGGMAGRGDRRG